MTSKQWIIGFVIAVLFLMKDVFCLKNVVLTIEPRIVERHHRSTLYCSYDLEDDVLYSVKWYRGRFEFYRYTPAETPKMKVFPYAGITVDENLSNSTQCVLKEIEFNLAGNFSCEVTTDAPFATAMDTQSMVVVQLPEESPKISVGWGPLDYGDTLRANCSSSPSRPPATLIFKLNNLTVASTDPIPPRRLQETSWSDLSLAMRLDEYHFNNGRLILRCVAQVSDIYRSEAELHLESARDPVPERVSAFDSASSKFTQTTLILLLFLYTLILYS